jgi:eukaryotic-like serine/threonine-protein kinase
MEQSRCPSEQELMAFHFGTLPEQGLEEVKDHLERCPHCETTVQRLDQVTDPVLEAIRRPMPSSPTSLAAGTASYPASIARQLEDLVEGQELRSAVARAGLNTESDGLLSRETTDGRPETFAFLSPPQGPDEIGWLAHYRVLRVLGKGGMGIVFQAEDTDLQRFVALKVLRPELACDLANRTRFLREARAMAGLQSDHVAAIHQVGQDRDVPYLALEFLHGETLERWRKRSGAPQAAEVLRLGREIAEGLAAAHRHGQIHRDIKPANIWLEVRPGVADRRVKVLDFGLALACSRDSRLTQQGMVVGTPGYIAPEQAAGMPVDERCDLFSLGCVLYWLATGEPPFYGETTLAMLNALATKDPRHLKELRPDLPPALSALVMRLLAKDPTDRPLSAVAVAEGLRAIEQNPGMPAEEPGATRIDMPRSATLVARTPGRRRLAAAALLLAPLLGLGAWAIVPRDNGPSSTATQPEPAPVVLEDEQTWRKTVAGMRPEGQLKAVTDRLRQLNPAFVDPVNPRFAKEGLVELALPSNQVTNLTPLQALPNLQRLDCSGNGSTVNGALLDLAQLRGLKLTRLDCNFVNVASLLPLKHMPLEKLSVSRTQVVDLKPLAGMKLTYLDCSDTEVSDLSPLKDMPLVVLRFDRTRVTSLADVKKMPLVHVSCEGTAVEDLSPLAGKQLNYFRCMNTKVHDLSPLQDMPIENLTAPIDNARNAKIIRALPKVRTINGQTPEAFWASYPKQ